MPNRLILICIFVWLAIVITPAIVMAQGAGLISEEEGPFPDYAPIAKKLAKEILRPNTKPRVAVFSIADFKGELSESSIARSQANTKLFISKLQKKFANNAFVVGPSGIRQELEALGHLSHDPSQIDFDDPKSAREWLDQALPDVFDFVLFAKMSEYVMNNQLTVLVVSKSDHKVVKGELTPPIGIDDEAVVSPNKNGQRYISVTLFAVENAASSGEGNEAPAAAKRIRIPLKYRRLAGPVGDEVMTRNEMCEPILASIPSELDQAMSEGRVSLEIELQHTGRAIAKTLVDKEVDNNGFEGYYVYTLHNNQNRLLGCAVSIDGKTTIEETINEPSDPSIETLGFPENEPQHEMRKWLLPQKGYQIKYRLSASNVYSPVLNPDQSPVIEQARNPVMAVVKGFQRNNGYADSFRLSKPSLGSPASAGISTSPGLIRISVYAQKLRTDGRHSEVMSPASDDDEGAPVRILAGPAVKSEVVSMKVPCYRPPLEEFLILLRSEKQLVASSGNLAEYVQAVTGK